MSMSQENMECTLTNTYKTLETRLMPASRYGLCRECRKVLWLDSAPLSRASPIE